MTRDFVDASEAGKKLAATLVTEAQIILAVLPNGAHIAVEIARKLNLPIVGIVPERNLDADVPVTVDVSHVRCAPDIRVLVVDDAVETGTAARAVARALSQAGFEHVELAVPICPRDSEHDMLRDFDKVHAVVRPMMRRSLNWHYEHVPNYTIEETQTLIATFAPR